MFEEYMRSSSSQAQRRFAALWAFRIIQSIWVTGLAYVALHVLAARSMSPGIVLFDLFVACYMIAAVGLYFDRLWAWRLSLALLALYWAVRGWAAGINFLVNNVMFTFGHPLYRDSPGTIFIVWIGALFGIVPASFLLFIALKWRKDLVHLMMPAKLHP